MNHTTLRFSVALTCIASLTACSDRSGAEKLIRISLKDPESARFGEFYFNAKTKRGCLAVNAKNSMGGYTGTQHAYVQKTNDGWEQHGIAELSMESCREVFADRTD